MIDGKLSKYWDELESTTVCLVFDAGRSSYSMLVGVELLA